MRDPNNPCLFCNSKISGIAHENDLAYSSYDTYPISKHHCLIIPKRHLIDYFELTNEELIACNDLIKKIINKDITINSLKEFEEIILIGSGKGVASVKTIDQIKWKRKSLKYYKVFLKHYKSAINNCPRYR